MAVIFRDNSKEGDLILWYDAVVMTPKGIKHCVCPCDKCKDMEQALVFYANNYAQVGYELMFIQYHLYTKEQLKQLAICC